MQHNSFIEKQRELKMQYHAVIDAMAEPIHIVNKNLEILFINKAFKRWVRNLGLELDIIGQKLFDLYPFLPDKIQDEYHQIFTSGKSLITEETQKVRNVEVSTQIEKDPIFSEGEVKWVVTIYRNITEHKQMEKSIEETEEKLQLFMDSTIDAFSLWDSDLNLISTNKAAMRMIPQEIREKGVIGANLVEFDFTRAKGTYSKYMNVIKTGIPYVVENSVPHPIFGDKYFNIKAFKVGSGMGMIIRDITEQKRAEEEIRRSEEKFRRLTENIFDVVLEANSDGKLIYISPEVFNLLGYRPNEIIGIQGLNFIHPDDLEKATKAMAKTANLKDRIEVEYRAQHKDGHYVPISGALRRIQEGDDFKLIGVFRDITEHKKTEFELKQSKTITDNLNEALLLFDMDGLASFANPTYEKITGYKSSELIGKSGIEIAKKTVVPHEVDKIVETFGKAVKGEELPPLSTYLKNKNGKITPIDFTVSFVRDDQGNAIQIVAVIRDITEQKQAEEKLRSFVDAAIDPFLLFDSDLNIIDINETALKGLGVNREDVLGMAILDISPDLKETGRYNRYMEVMMTGKPLVIQDLVPSPKFGEIHVELKAFKVGDGLGLITRDITENRRAEEALRESEEKFRLLSEQSMLGIVILQDGLIKYVNNALAEMIEITPEEMLKWKADEWVSAMHPDDRSIAIQQARKKQMGEIDVVIHSSYRLITKTGKTKWVENYSKTITYKGKTADFITLIDITERIKAEEALRESEERLRAFMDSATDAFSLWDSKLNLIDINKAGMEIIPVEIKKTGVIGRNFTEFGSMTKEIVNYNRYIEVIRTGKPLIMENIVTGTLFGNIHVIIKAFKVGKGMGMIVTDITKHKEAEKALRESEKKYRTILESIEDGYYEVDLAGNLTFFNDSLCKLLGYSKNELIGMNYRAYMDDETGNKVYHTFNTVYESGRPTKATDWEIIRKDRTKRFNEASISLILKSSGEPVGFRGVVRDITKRMEMEEALRESEVKFRNIIESIPMGMHMYQIEEDGNLIFIGANHAADEILGINHEQLKGKTIEDAFPSSMETEIPDHYRAAATKGIIWTSDEITYEDERIKGAYEVCAFQTSPGMMVASFLDITERKKTEESLKESERKYRTLITTMTDGIVVTDIFNRITLVNPALEKMLGFNEDEMLDHLVIEFLDPDSIEIFKEKSKQRHSGLVPSEEYELVFINKNGDKVTTRVAAKVLMVGSQISGSFAVISDITKERELEQRRASFMSMTAHELRTPTTIIRGYAELLEAFFSDLGLEQNEKFFIPLQKIIKNVQRLERLISDVRDIMRIDRGVFQLQKEPVIINELLDEFLSSYKVILKDQLEYSISYLDSPVQIESDPVRLLQVFGNLMQNAIDHTSKDNRQITVSSTITSEDIIIKFSDNGAGIEPTYLEKIFEPFLSIPTEFTVQGTGVGLYLSRFIIQAHNGILLASSKGKGFGATFTVRLPRT
ncbi:MAG: PAS domain S-box protein [Promethearchaeota archaeon]